VSVLLSVTSTDCVNRSAQPAPVCSTDATAEAHAPSAISTFHFAARNSAELQLHARSLEKPEKKAEIPLKLP
jgi:hypothetical protein